MKYLKNINELNQSTYKSAASRLSRLGYNKRAEEILKHNKNTKMKRDTIIWKEKLQTYSKYGLFNFDIKQKGSGSEISGEFALSIYSEFNSNDKIYHKPYDNRINIYIDIIPATEELRKNHTELISDNDREAAFNLILFYDIEDSRIVFKQIKLLNCCYDQEVRFSDRASAGKFKRLLVNLFTDENLEYPYEHTDSSFYETFEGEYLSGLSLSSEFGLTMKDIANYINSESTNELCRVINH
jgi:hypothetical protein